MVKNAELRAISELICNMTLGHATKEELERAINYSKDFMDYIKDTKNKDDITRSYEANNILELETKYNN
jgi:polyhydroxyalkanoate synthesis regulator protein